MIDENEEYKSRVFFSFLRAMTMTNTAETEIVRNCKSRKSIERADNHRGKPHVLNVWSDIENVLNSALSMSLSSLSMSSKAENGIRIEECLVRFFTITRIDSILQKK